MKDILLVLDVETANSVDDALVYDLGLAVVDRKGNIYCKKSFVNSDIFYGEANLMTSSYYAHKLPKYYEEIKNGEREVATLYEIRQFILGLFEQYKIRAVCAYNASFDQRALNTTQRWQTKSKYRYFLPYDVEIWDIWHMACQVICTMTTYRKFCETHNYFSKSGNMITNAETVYQFITKDDQFREEHMGLADVEIETQIMANCFRKHKTMDKGINRACWRIPQKSTTPKKRKPSMYDPL